MEGELEPIVMYTLEYVIDRTEYILRQWCRRQTRLGRHSNAAVLRAKATEIYERIVGACHVADEGVRFVADDAWLERYRRKHDPHHPPDVDEAIERDVDLLIVNVANGLLLEKCRICLSDDLAHRSVLECFDEEQTTIADIIASICSIQLQQNDFTPNNICVDCFEDLRCAYSFRKRCQTSENLLSVQVAQIADGRFQLDIKEEPLEDNVHETVNLGDENDALENNSIVTLHALASLQIQINDESISESDRNEQYNVKGEEYSSHANAVSQIHIDCISPTTLLQMDTNVYQCDQCPYICPTEDKLQNHKAYDHLELKNYTCTQCNYATNVRYSLMRHMDVHIVEKNFACNKCDYKGKTVTHLKRHSLKHIRESKYACDSCEFVCQTSSVLKTHLWRHTAEKKYVCDQCKYSSITKHDLRRHLETHALKKDYTCDGCDFMTHSSYNMKRHALQHAAEKKYKCDKCDYASTVRRNLEGHAETHTDEKKYACDKCDYVTKTSQCLKQHLSRHIERKFTCDRCDYASMSKWCLKRHFETHIRAAENNYACDKCDYVTHSTFNMKRHLMKHAAEKKYACDRCDYASMSKWCLNRHYKIHTDEKN